MKATLLKAFFIVICLILIVVLQNRIEAVEDDNDTTNLLYVPDIRVLHGLMLGDDAVAADLLWLLSIFYMASFHNHHAHGTEKNHIEHDKDVGEKKYDSAQSFHNIDFGENIAVKKLLFSNEHRNDAIHLTKLLNMVTDLDSTFVTPYYEGAINLGLEFGRIDEAIELLNKGIRAVPEQWEMYYYSGFIKLFYLNDKSGAADDMIKAAIRPNAPPNVVQQAAAFKVWAGTPRYGDRIP
jgi:hypothetical protein